MNKAGLHWVSFFGLMCLTFIIHEVCAFDTTQKTTYAETPSFRVELNNVYPVHNRMPGGRPRTYLLAELKFINLTDHLMRFEIKRATISFNAKEEGEAKKVSVRDEFGLATGKMKMQVSAGEHIVKLRGDAVFGNDRDGQELYLTLILSTPQGDVVVRNFGRVEVVF